MYCLWGESIKESNAAWRVAAEKPPVHFQLEKAKSAGLNVSSGEKRAYLCKEHYKEFKKKTKKDKTVEKWRYGT